MEIVNQLNGGCLVGILIVSGVEPSSCEKLDTIKKEIEGSVRAHYAGMPRNELKSLHPMDQYVSYYKKFAYTYHVLSQVESVASGKEIPAVSPLVEAMFLSEIKNMMLTAGHDLEKISFPLYLKVATGAEGYVTLGGKDVTAVPGDYLIGDGEGVMSSIIRGPDKRTSILDGTKGALYTAYAPQGISKELVYAHLSDIESYVKIFSPQSVTVLKQVYGDE